MSWDSVSFGVFLAIPLVALVWATVLVLDTDDSLNTVEVKLRQRSDMPPVRQISQPSNGSLRVAISGVLSAGKTIESYEDLLVYMSGSLGQQHSLILKPTYAEINDLIRGERAEVAFVCSLAYVKGNEEFGMELLAVPQKQGKSEYYSYLIVPSGSDDTSLRDLKGGTFAFTDPLSNSGHLVPTYQLSLMGERSVSFFSKYVYTYNHDYSIMAVADRLVDGAAVDSWVYDDLIANNPEIASKTRVIERWGPYGAPPIVVSPALDSQLKERLRAFFLDFHNSEEGARLLAARGIDKFVTVPDSAYDNIRKMKASLGW